MDSEIHQLYELMVRSSGLSPAEQGEWVAFGKVLEEQDLLLLIELLEQEPQSLASIAQGAVLGSEYMRTQDPKLLEQIEQLSLENLNEIMSS